MVRHPITYIMNGSSHFTPFTLDPYYPFYIHPSNNPKSQMVTVPFSGFGFVLRRNSMLDSLSAKNKLGILNGRNPKPTPDSPYSLC